MLASFQDDAIGHIANGRKGLSAGTGLVRLNMEGLQSLTRPIPFAELKNTLPAKFRGHLEARSITAAFCLRNSRSGRRIRLLDGERRRLIFC